MSFEPKAENLKKNRNYSWCSCILSKEQPFCDGSHAGTDKKSLRFKVEEDGLIICVLAKKHKTRHFVTGLIGLKYFT